MTTPTIAPKPPVAVTDPLSLVPRYPLPIHNVETRPDDLDAALLRAWAEFVASVQGIGSRRRGN